MAEKEVIIELKDVYKKFGTRQILSGVSLQVYKGETLVIMGGSGCGKSTVLRHMTGAVKPDSGSVYMRGQNLSDLDEDGLDALRKKLDVEELEKEDIVKLVGDMTRDEAVNFFVEVGLPVGPVLYASDATKDPHINARNMFTDIEHPRLGKIKVINFPVKFSETPGEVHSAAPLLGQHNREILKNILDYVDDEIDLLEKEGAITSERI